jgi:hypothetical protein
LVMPQREMRIQIAKDLDDASDCCVCSMTAKVKKLGRTKCESWRGVLKHRGLISCITIWSWVARLCNMHLERLLSLVRKSAPLRCVVERLLHSGFLSQVMQRHLQAGGSDIRAIRRKDALKTGAPLRCKARLRQRRSAPGQLKFAKWANAEVREEKRMGRKMDRDGYKTRMQELKAEYGNDKSLAVDSRADSREWESLAEPSGQTYDDRVQGSLSCCSSAETPLLSGVLQFEIDQSVRKSLNARTGGLTERLKPIREEQVKSLFVKDSNSLPLSEKYAMQVPCCHLHPDICKKKLAGDGRGATLDALRAMCKRLPRCSLIALQMIDQHEATMSIHYKICAYQDPLLFAQCDVKAGKPEIVTTGNGEIAWETGEAGLARAWPNGIEPAKIILMHFIRQKPVTMAEATSVLPACLGDSREYVLWPKPPIAPGEVIVEGYKPSAEVLELNELAKKLAKFQSTPHPADYEPESEDDDELSISKLEKSLGGLLRAKRAKASRKRVAVQSKVIAAKKAKLATTPGLHVA